MKLILIAGLCMVFLGLGYAVWAQKEKYTPVEWEHGFKTSLVVATRYNNPMMGYNIGFTFPKNPDDCDRTELVDFIESKGGSAYQMGGYPGAEMFVIFKDVKNKEDANKKLREILSDFSRVVSRL